MSRSIPDDSAERLALKELVQDIREEVSYCVRPGYVIARENLRHLAKRLHDEVHRSYKYDRDKYPPLKFVGPRSYVLNDEPKNLPEFFIWKQGDWIKYRKFVDHYLESNLEDAPSDRVVHFAFAHHLWSEGRLPIFDQHSARALWAIMGRPKDEIWKRYRDYLFTTNGRSWRSNSFLTDSQAKCYEAFRGHAEDLANTEDFKWLDRLLMPLGKALKDHAKSVSRFSWYCGVGWT